MSLAASGVLPGAGGVGIHYRIDGPQDAPWLVLSNSLATDLRMWEPQITTFSQTHRVLCYDTRGHGQSEAAQGPYTFDQLTGDMLALCDGLDIAQANVVGLSLGGMTALALAMRAPDRVRRLVCCDARVYAPEPYRAIWDTNIDRLNDVGISGLVEPTIARWFTPEFTAAAENAETLELVRSMIAGTSAVGYEGAARLLQALDLRAGLATLAPETLYITGESDMAAPVEIMQDMADQTPKAEFTVLPGAAHLSNMEQPGAFTRRVLEFLQA